MFALGCVIQRIFEPFVVQPAGLHTATSSEMLGLAPATEDRRFAESDREWTVIVRDTVQDSERMSLSELVAPGYYQERDRAG